jgi:hypothetical protein
MDAVLASDLMNFIAIGNAKTFYHLHLFQQSIQDFPVKSLSKVVRVFEKDLQVIVIMSII